MKLIIYIFLLILIVILLFFSYKLWKNWSDNKRRNVENRLKMIILTNLYYIIQYAGSLSDTKPFMIYGTLLGKIRLNDILCHDFDVDYGIIENEFEKFYEKIKYIIENNNEYKVNKINMFGIKFMHIVHKPTGLSADISGFTIKSNLKIKRNVPYFYSKYIQNEKYPLFPVEWIFPLQAVYFLGKLTYVPNNPDKLLTNYYGTNYIIPDKVCDENCENCHSN